MSCMDRVLYDVLSNINEGIVVLNEKLEICLWNNYMEQITGISKEQAINSNIYTILPSLNKTYFNKSIYDVLNNGYKFFFSAAMHKKLLNDTQDLNLKISRSEKDGSRYLLLEFTDVTNQFARINQLKGYINELSLLNKELKEKEQVIKKLAYYDSLTGLANRALFYEIAEKFLANAKRNNDLLGMMFIDIDKFKGINDTYGHKIGDNVIIEASKVLKSSIRESDIVARFGGDEFLVLLPHINSYSNSETIASRILNSSNKTINCNGTDIKISLSIGISFFPCSGDNIDELIFKADKAMYTAKIKGNSYFLSA